MNASVHALTPTNTAAEVVLEGELIKARLCEVHVEPGHNPRQRINEQSPSFIELVDSVKAKGVVQPIVIRPRAEGGYWIVAGHRRHRASVLVGLETIPAVLKNLSDKEAKEQALVENTGREDVTPIEEAVAAHVLLDMHDGNREEVMARLGWNKAKLDRRLLLLHAVPEVRDAFLDGEIPLQFVELLAGIPAESQVGTMKKAIEAKMTVQQLKERLDAATEHLKLGSAIFGAAECNGCPHNSSSQASLFSEHISEGRCMNRACYGEKVKVALEQKKVALTGDFNVVFLDTEKLPTSWSILTATGSDGVGMQQFSQCKGCGHFGALLSSAPGREGAVTDDVCFNKECMGEKIAAYKKEISDAAKEASTPKAKPSPATTATVKTASKKANSTPKKAAVASTPAKVNDAVDAFYREQAGELTRNDPRLKLAMAAHALYKDASGFDLKPYIGEENHLYQRPDLVEAFFNLDPATGQRLIADMAVYIAGQKKETSFHDKELVKTAERIVGITGTQLAGRFKLTAEFLKAHTKAGIEALLTEAADSEGKSFADWYNAKEGKETAFKSLFSKKTDDLITAILESGFDFSRFVPSSVAGRITKTASASE
jgi:PRTRC genetic system ParB family protein